MYRKANTPACTHVGMQLQEFSRLRALDQREMEV